jgi:xanthine dehydrogenase YagR molybdenum-binding subunit
MTPEISLTQAPAHLRHGSNIGQPLTRRDGVLKVKGEVRPACSTPLWRSAASREAA